MRSKIKKRLEMIKNISLKIEENIRNAAKNQTEISKINKYLEK